MHSELKESMQLYMRLGLRPKLRFDSGDCTWDHILDMIVLSQKEYAEKATVLRGLFQKVWRKTGDHSSRVAPLLEMIPDDVGLTVLKGGLGWILTVSAARNLR